MLDISKLPDPGEFAGLHLDASYPCLRNRGKGWIADDKRLIACWAYTAWMNKRNKSGDTYEKMECLNNADAWLVALAKEQP